MWQELAKNKPKKILDSDPESGLDLAGQRLQVVQIKDKTATLIADLVALNLELLSVTKEGLQNKGTNVLALIPNQNLWTYEEKDGRDTSKWAAGETPSIAALLETAWFVSLLGPRAKTPRIQIGPVFVGRDSAHFGPAIPQISFTQISQNSIEIDPAASEFIPRDGGLFVSRTDLWQAPESDFNGSPILRPDSGARAQVPGTETSLRKGLQDADLTTIDIHYRGFNGLLRQLRGDRKASALNLSNWIVGQPK